MTLNEIKAKCRMEGECWIWTGSKDRHGNPVFYANGNRYPYRPRWLIAEAAMKKHMPSRMRVMSVCGHAACLNPAHLTVGLGGQNKAGFTLAELLSGKSGAKRELKAVIDRANQPPEYILQRHRGAERRAQRKAKIAAGAAMRVKKSSAWVDDVDDLPLIRIITSDWAGLPHSISSTPTSVFDLADKPLQTGVTA